MNGQIMSAAFIEFFFIHYIDGDLDYVFRTINRCSARKKYQIGKLKSFYFVFLLATTNSFVTSISQRLWNVLENVLILLNRNVPHSNTFNGCVCIVARIHPSRTEQFSE